MAKDRSEVDAATGVRDTGHEWDGIRELNTPLPRWWLWTFYATIVWAIGYWVVYPAWPLVWGHTTGLAHWNSRTDVVERLAELQSQRGVLGKQLAAADLNQIRADRDLFDFARAQGKAAFASNCAQCHGTGAAGAPGYPNLNDDDWLWGGTLEQIAFTIRHGIRSEDRNTRMNQMPAFGRDGLLPRADVQAAADYVLALSRPDGAEDGSPAALQRGKEIFAAQCASCHGPDGGGKKDLGAPNLRDQIWLHAGDRQTVVATIWNGRGGVMPHWGERLDEATIKSLATYVYSLGGGE